MKGRENSWRSSPLTWSRQTTPSRHWRTQKQQWVIFPTCHCRTSRHDLMTSSSPFFLTVLWIKSECVFWALFGFQVDAMKIGAKEMKKAYKDVKLDQIDVWFFFFFPHVFFFHSCFAFRNKSILLIYIMSCGQRSGFTGPAGGHDGRSQRGSGGPEPQLRHPGHRWGRPGSRYTRSFNGRHKFIKNHKAPTH